MKPRICVIGLGAGLLLGLGSGCDEKIRVLNSAPEVQMRGICGAQGRVYFVVDVLDREEDPVDIVVNIGGTRAGIGATADGAFGLSSSRKAAIRHFVEWARDAEACSGAFPEVGDGEGCQVAPDPLPRQVSGTLYASDRSDDSATSFMTGTTEVCPAP